MPSAARSRSASRSISIASLPPHSKIVGTIRCAQLAATFFAVRVEPVNEILSIGLSVRAWPVSGRPVIVVKRNSHGANFSKVSAIHMPTPGVYSLGLKTTAFPAASAYAIDPIGVKSG